MSLGTAVSVRPDKYRSAFSKIQITLTISDDLITSNILQNIFLDEIKILTKLLCYFYHTTNVKTKYRVFNISTTLNGKLMFKQ